MERGFSLPDAEVVAGLSRRQVRTLCAPGGAVLPSVKVGGDRARARLDRFDLVKLACLSQLAAVVGGDMRGPWVAEVAQAVEQLRGADLGAYAVVWDREGASTVPAVGVDDALAESAAAVVLRPKLAEKRVDSRLARELGVLAAA